MLRKNSSQKLKANGGTFAIVASRYNSEYVDAMLIAARNELLGAGAKIEVIRVPGAFEIPAVAAKLAATTSRPTPNTPRLSAIICLGVIFQGETSHAQHIGE